MPLASVEDDLAQAFVDNKIQSSKQQQQKQQLSMI
jgi:hypothetical protein